MPQHQWLRSQEIIGVTSVYKSVCRRYKRLDMPHFLTLWPSHLQQNMYILAIYYLLSTPQNLRTKHCWYSGIMQDSHSCDLGSIPGQCTLLFHFLRKLLKRSSRCKYVLLLRRVLNKICHDHLVF